MRESPSETPSDPVTGTVPVNSSEVREQLARILDSPAFKSSKRCSDFLRHVVDATLTGRAGALKERNLGAAIFERPLDYDTNQDPIVRNTAGQIRKRLAQYYHSPGHETELRIDLPPGSYVPEIAPPAVIPAPAAPPSTEPPRARRTFKWWQITAAIAVIIAAAAAALSTRGPAASELDAFWAPVLGFSGPVTICVGQGHTYKLSQEWDRYFEGQAGERSPQPQPSGSIPIDTVVPAWDRYIGISDAQATIRLAALFARSGKQIALRGGRTTSLADLRGKPVVLVGAFNNEWTLRLTGELRFYFDGQGDSFFVRDRLHPDNHAWQVQPDPTNPRIHTDYAIVSRVHSLTTEHAVFVAGGIKGGGTYTTGEFLTNANYISTALKNAPAGWEHKNVQFVLATKMYSGTPGPPQVVASHYW